MSGWKARHGTLKARATSAMMGQTISYDKITEKPGAVATGTPAGPKVLGEVATGNPAGPRLMS